MLMRDPLNSTLWSVHTEKDNGVTDLYPWDTLDPTLTHSNLVNREKGLALTKCAPPPDTLWFGV